MYVSYIDTYCGYVSFKEICMNIVGTYHYMVCHLAFMMMPKDEIVLSYFCKILEIKGKNMSCL